MSARRARHTPGPWSWAPGDECIHAQNGTVYVAWLPTSPAARKSRVVRADIRLITSAPDMRELLERIREELDGKADVVDDGPEQKPNWAMSLCSDIDVLLAKIDGVRL